MKKNILMIAFMLSIFQISNAQQNRKENKINEIATHTLGSNWYTFDKGLTLSKNNINSKEVKAYFGFDDNNSFSFIKSDTDDLKIIHQHFQQFYKGIPLQYMTFKLHQFPNKTLEGNGQFVAGFNKIMPQTISFQQALDFAKNYYPSQQYMWEDSLEEKLLIKRTHGRKSTYFPKEELIWAAINKNTNENSAENYCLAYKINLASKKPWFNKEIYIDASNGRLLNTKEREHKCGTISFNSNFNGSKICLYKNSSSPYELIDECGLGGEITVSNNGTLFTTPSSIPWNTSNIDIKSACSSLWATREAAKYFYYVHGRDGWDAFAGDIDLRQNAEFDDDNNSLTYPTYNNASFSPSGILLVGNANPQGPNGPNLSVSDDYNSFDIMAHEFTHGVTFETCDLEYEGESGALNESFSDIFAVNAYQNNGGFSSDSNLWLLGYDRTNSMGNHLYLRNMRDPHDVGDPDTYLSDPLWRNTSPTAPDHGGVHFNSGVQNKMYYLLVKGGSGTNSNGTSYNISGIGYIKGRAIAYRALTAAYLNSNSNFPDARAAWVHASNDLYGYCSTESIAVGKAWEAVGINPPNNYNPYCGTYGNFTQSFNNGGPAFVSLSNCGVNIIGSGNQVSINSSNYIDILPGMNTNVGAFYTSDINNCIYTNY